MSNRDKMILLGSFVIVLGGLVLANSYENNMYVYASLSIAVLILIGLTLVVSNRSLESAKWEMEKLNSKIDAKKLEVTNAILTNFHQTESLINIHKELPEIINLNHTRDWAASPDVLQIIVEEFKKVKPQNIIETGSGVSTLIFAALLRKNGIKGKVYSLDHDAFYAQKTRDKIKENNLEEYVEVIDSPLKEYELDGTKYKWYNFEKLTDESVQFDMAFVDGPPTTTNKLARYPFFNLLKERLNSKFTLVVDDANRPDEIEMVRLWQESNKDLKVERGFCEKGALIVRNF